MAEETEKQNFISVGDLQIGSTTEDLSSCANLCVGMLRNRTIKSYLKNDFVKKKFKENFGIG